MKISNLFRSLSSRLILSFVSVGLVTVLLLGFISYQQSKNSLISQASKQLEAVREIKKNQIEGFFFERTGDITVFSRHPSVVDGLGSFLEVYNTHGANSPAYDSVNLIYGPHLTELKEVYGYYDLFLISNDGEIVYTVARESDFATNLISGAYSKENIATAFKKGKEKITLVDFQNYSPSNDDPASFMAAPIFNGEGKKTGVLVLQIPLDKINEIMLERSGMGESGETYIVGQDYLMRSDSRFEEESTVLKRTIKTEAVEQAFSLNANAIIMDDYRGVTVLSAFNKLKIPGLNWVILSEIDYEEVLLPVIKLRNAIFLVALGAFVMIVLAAYYMARSIAKPIKDVRDSLVKMGHGELPDEVNEATTDKETSEMSIAINSLIRGLGNFQTFSTEIGNGNLKAAFEPLSEQDALGNALLRMRDNLFTVEVDEKKRTWINEGIAQFSEILRSDQNDVKVLSTKITTSLVNYLGANQGMLYIINEESNDNRYLELLASYAWNRQKFQENTIQKGEGLTGQCWQEGEMILLKHVPDSFVKITSGIGEASPKNIIYMPLKVNEAIFGVIELASFLEFEEHHIEFLKKLSENLAATISSAKINEKTMRLLEYTQQQTEELRAQEEEMRQNMEELQATQEEMHRKEKEYLKTIADLNNKVDKKKVAVNGTH